MGELKELLRQSHDEYVDSGKYYKENEVVSSLVKREYKRIFLGLSGKPVIWRTKNNINIRTPQLVIVEKPYENFVVVLKTSFNTEGVENKVRYTILYSSLRCRHDTFETLEVK